MEDEIDYLTAITLSSAKGLKKFNLKRERFDTIREGALISLEILEQIGAKEVITSGVGVREGVFLKDLLRHNNLIFPKGVNPSTRSILDRFDNLTAKDSSATHRIKISSELYAICHKEFGLSLEYSDELNTALKLSNIGKTLTIYNSRQHAFYIAMQELNYGFSHKEMLLTSLLLRTFGSSLLKKSLFQTYKQILPQKDVMICLSFIYNLSILLHENANEAKISFDYHNQTLTIHSDQSLYHAKEPIKALEKPQPFAIIIEDNTKMPKYSF